MIVRVYNTNRASTISTMFKAQPLQSQEIAYGETLYFVAVLLSGLVLILI